jgi:hypothetical protein
MQGYDILRTSQPTTEVTVQFLPDKALIHNNMSPNSIPRGKLSASLAKVLTHDSNAVKRGFHSPLCIKIDARPHMDRHPSYGRIAEYDMSRYDDRLPLDRKTGGPKESKGRDASLLPWRLYTHVSNCSTLGSSS